MTVLLNTF